MAKVTGPLMSLDASGAFADTMVFAKWKGINYSRQYSVPSNPQTENQVKVREYFTAAVAAWQAETQETKDAWNTAANGQQLSGFNLYVSGFINYKNANNGTAPASPFVPS